MRKAVHDDERVAVGREMFIVDLYQHARLEHAIEDSISAAANVRFQVKPHPGATVFARLCRGRPSLAKKEPDDRLCDFCCYGEQFENRTDHCQ